MQNLLKENEEQNLTIDWLCDTGEMLRFTFIDADSPENFLPIKQCYGLCFNENGEIALGRNPHANLGNWLLPGGRPEIDETPEETLKREILEELDIVADKIHFLGAQRVESLTDPSKEIFYQLRYAVIIKEILPLTPDPDNGTTWERKFVKPSEVESYLKWGSILEHLVKRATEWFEKENILL